MLYIQQRGHIFLICKMLPLKTCCCVDARWFIAFTVTPGPPYEISVTEVPSLISRPSDRATGTHEYPLRTETKAFLFYSYKNRFIQIPL